MLMKVKDETDNLTLDELEKRLVRRERNKIAAAKCRQRRLDRISYLTQKTDQMKSIQDSLMKKLKQVEEIEKNYQDILQNHQCTLKLKVNDKTLETNNKPIHNLSLELPDLKTPNTEYMFNDLNTPTLFSNDNFHTGFTPVSNYILAVTSAVTTNVGDVPNLVNL